MKNIKTFCSRNTTTCCLLLFYFCVFSFFIFSLPSCNQSDKQSQKQETQKIRNQKSEIRNSPIDSLQTLLNQKIHDTTRINILNSLSSHLRSSSSDSARTYSTQALELAEEIGYQKGIAASLDNIGIIHSDLSDYPKSLDYYHRALKIFEEIGDMLRIKNSLSGIGVIYYSEGNLATNDTLRKVNYSKALKYFQQTLKINEELGDKMGMVLNLKNIGWVYMKQGLLVTSREGKKDMFPKASELFFKALKSVRRLVINKALPLPIQASASVINKWVIRLFHSAI